jgi:CheY-like chemotaxis protein
VTLLQELAGDLAYGIMALRAKAERDHAYRLSAHRADQLRALAAELVQAESRERQRLAKILHDHLQQLLVAAKYAVSSLARKEAARERCQQVTDMLDQAIQAGRSLTAELSPPILQEKGLGVGLQWLARTMRERHGLMVDVEADLTAVPLEQHILIFVFEAVRELLFNVVKHAKAGTARIRCQSANGQLVVTVEDDGVGFDVGRLEEGASAGTGFGLFSIKERAGYFGGRVIAESSAGGGSRFKLFVPLGPGPAACREADAGKGSPARVTPAKAVSESEPRIRVLLVDDHPVMRQGLAGLLQDQTDIAVAGEAGDGQTGIELARALRPDVVVMDVSMPVMDGIAATEAIRAELPGIVVIGLSMHEDPAMELAMRSAGAVDFLNKGGPSEALISAIRSAVRHAPSR